MLSNFYEYPQLTVDGQFNCIEAYWYWLMLPDVDEFPDKEMLRILTGSKAKEVGCKLREQMVEIGYTLQDEKDAEAFQFKILSAIETKFRAHRHLMLKRYEKLPITHYYNYSGKLVDASKNYRWYTQGVDSIRKRILNEEKVKRLRILKGVSGL